MVNPIVNPHTICLTVTGPSGKQKIEQSGYATLLVGRSSGAQVCVSEDPHFSRRHCLLELAPPQARLVDLKSRNGTFVNGQRVDIAILKSGDVISGGQTSISVGVGENRAEMLTLPAPDFTSTAPIFMPVDEAATVDNICPRTRIGKYEIEGELGRGAMGVVYKARDLATKQLAALKLIIPTRAVTESQVKLFLREASILSTLDHRRIVRLLEIGLDAGRLFLAMEYVEHQSFDQLSESASQRRLIRLSCAIVSQALSALAYSHEKKIVHRDIKPSNLLTCFEGGRLAVRVADFGLAKNYADAGFSGITQTGELRGTFGYIAPEQLRNSQRAEPAADIFSSGATLYHFLCGAYPYEINEGDDPIRAILTQEPVSIRSRLKGLPNGLIYAIDRATAKEPEERFESAVEMQKSLEPFLRKS
jgi:eukaryotic-like serine/threonine-protein kinase